MEKEKVDIALSSEEFYQKYGRKKSIATLTLGCKTNQYETDAIMALFSKEGYEAVAFDERADLYLVNTCTVTAVGNKKSRQMIRRAKKMTPNALVVVMGCYAQVSTEEVAQLDEVDIILGTNARNRILSYIETYIREDQAAPVIHVDDIMQVKEFEDMTLGTELKKTRAFIKIQEGCNQYCSYCIIPYARGRVRSRQLDSIVSEIETLVASGYKEFVLTGIHIGSYGLDFGNVQLIDLLEAVDGIAGVHRVRLGSIEPRLITEDFVARIARLEHLCQHFHLSLQSGSEAVLRRMNRKYTPEAYEAAVERLRALYGEPSITTDIIVGFPGETEAEFEETVAYVKRIGFSEIHVFPYSIREGTPAATMPNQIEGPTKKARVEYLSAVGQQLKIDYMTAHIGQTLEVIYEEDDGTFAMGHTRNYLKLYWPKASEISGGLYAVTVESIKDDTLFGQRVK